MNDDTFLLLAWMDLMSDGSFAATFFGFDIVCRSRETRGVVRWYPKDHQ